MNSRVSLLLVLCLNLLLFLAQLSMDKIALAEGFTSSDIYDFEGNILSDVDLGNYTVKNTYSDELPSGSSSVESGDGNFFTDTFTAIKEWFLESTGVGYGLAFINAVPNMLKLLLPSEVAFALGGVWHIFTVFLIIMAFRGGD